MTTPKQPKRQKLVAKSPDIHEQLTEYYDGQLYNLTETAYRIPLWIASSFAPPLGTPYGPTNSSINVLMVGETGTGKSTIQKLIARTAPTFIKAEIFTTPSFTATAYKENGQWQLKPGYIPQAHNGILAVGEIDKLMDSRKLEGAIRESIENMTLSVAKATIKETYPSKYGLIVDCNFAGNDYFTERTTIIDQMGHSRRILSRIDDPIPFGYTTKQEIAGLIDFQTNLEYNRKGDTTNREAREIRNVYTKIKEYITNEIKCVGVQTPPEMSKQIGEKLKDLLSKHRGIKIIRARNFTTARKLIQASTILHAYNRQTRKTSNGTVLIPGKKDLEIAFTALELITGNVAKIMEIEQKDRIFQTPTDTAVNTIKKLGPQAEKPAVVKAMQGHNISKATAYRILNRLLRKSVIIEEGEGYKAILRITVESK